MFGLYTSQPAVHNVKWEDDLQGEPEVAVLDTSWKCAQAALASGRWASSASSPATAAPAGPALSGPVCKLVYKYCVSHTNALTKKVRKDDLGGTAEGKGSKSPRKHQHPLGIKVLTCAVGVFSSWVLELSSATQGRCYTGKAPLVGWRGCCVASLTQQHRNRQKCLLTGPRCKRVRFCVLQSLSAWPRPGWSLHRRGDEGEGRRSERKKHPQHLLPAPLLLPVSSAVSHLYFLLVR